MNGYVISREARLDLAAIDDYTAERWGDDQSRRYLAALWMAFDQIAAAPHIGRRRGDVPPPYVVHAVGSHLIIYRINSDTERVEILNILHPAMDIAARVAQALAQPPGSKLR